MRSAPAESPRPGHSTGEWTRVGPVRAAGAPLQESPGPLGPRLSVVAVIPAFNEASTIGGVVAGTRPYVDAVVVVDDGSTDATAALATGAGAEVVTMSQNCGKAAAVMNGLAVAATRGFGAVVLLDGDGQHSPDEIPLVVAPVIAGKADMVVGSRFLEVRSAIPAYRVFGQKTLNLFTALGAGVSLTDTQSGFRALGPAALAHLDFDSDGYSLESDMIAHFASRGLRFLEVPVSCRYDVSIRHKVNPVLHGLGILSTMTRAIFRRQRGAIGLAGMTLILTGSLFGVAPVFLAPLDLGNPLHAASQVFALMAVIGGSLVSVVLLSAIEPSLRKARERCAVDGNAAEPEQARANSAAGGPR